MPSALLVAALLAASPKLAAPGLRALGADDARAEVWTEHFAHHFTGVAVTTGQDIAQVLGLERQKQLAGCAETSACNVELASALGVAGVIVGDVAVVDGRYRVSLKVLSARDGRLLSRRSGVVGSEDALFDALAQAGREMAVETQRALALEPSAEALLLARPGPSKVKKWWWMPAVSGAVVAGVGGGLLAMAESRYLQVAQGAFPTRTAAEAVAAEGKTFTLLGWCGVGVGGAAVVSGLLMYLLGGDEVPALIAWLGPGGGGVALGGVFP